MVSVRECVVHNVPSLLVGKSLLIEQDSQQLDCGNSWVSVIELNCILLSEQRPVTFMVDVVSLDNVTD